MRAALLAALLGLAGALAATLFLHGAANAALDRAFDDRLRAAGESAALLLPAAPRGQLGKLMRADGLDGAYLLDKDLRVLDDATGPSGGRADLLRVDAERARRAFAGEATVAPAWSIGELSVATGYFPVRDASGAVTAVLALEAGEQFVRPRQNLARARWAALLLSLLTALALGFVAARVSRTQRRAAELEAVRRMAAMAAHEIRNPLGIIRGTIELLRERNQRSGAAPDPASAEALDDVLAEVERMRRLTEDFVDLGRDRPLSLEPLDLAPVLLDAASALEKQFPAVTVRRELPEALPPVAGDAGRLRQVFANLLQNAAQAQREGPIVLYAAVEQGQLAVRVQDHGPGVPRELRARVFDPFFTTRDTGTGLGLAIARKLVERHGGTLQLTAGPPGALFEVVLPLARS